MTANTLTHALDRRIVIRARPETVFRYFTDSEHWALWWGAGSTIDARPGGAMLIRLPDGTEVEGEVFKVDPPRHIEMSYGFTSGQPIPRGGSRLVITLEPDALGTRLHVRHEFAEAGVRDHHVQGWRYQLAVFANVVADGVHRSAGERVDAWFAAWSEPDAAKRARLLADAVSPAVRFRDRFSLVEGLADLEPHLAAVHVFMPGSRLERLGAPRHCQGTVLADWVAHGPKGEMGRGTNVFTLDADGRIEDVVGIWGPAGG